MKIIMFVTSICISLIVSAESQGVKTLIWKDGDAVVLKKADTCVDTYYRQGNLPLKGYFLKDTLYAKYEVSYKAKSWHLRGVVEQKSLIGGALLKVKDSYENSSVFTVVSNFKIEGVATVNPGTTLKVKGIDERIKDLSRQSLKILKDYELEGRNLRDLLWSVEQDEGFNSQTAECGYERIEYIKLVTKIGEQNLRLLLPFDESEKGPLSETQVVWTDLRGEDVVEKTSSGAILNVEFSEKLETITINERKSVAFNFKNAISENDAKETAPGVVSLFNKRIGPKAKKIKLELLRDIREELLASDKKYLCVDNHLSGFPEKIGENAVKLLYSTDEVFYVEGVEPFQQDNGKSKSKFIRIKYQGKEYWAKENWYGKKEKIEHKYISTFAECPKIQLDIENLRLEQFEALNKQDGPKTIMGIPLSKPVSLNKYVCIAEEGNLNASLTAERKNEFKIPEGAEVSIVQGRKSKPFGADNGHTYIRVQYEGKRYWVAKTFIKSYEDCPQIHTKPTKICRAVKLVYYSSDEDLSDGKWSGNFEAFEYVYRFYGDVFSRKVVINEYGKEIVYVPVKKNRKDQDVKWIQERFVPKTCKLSMQQRSEKITYGAHNGEKCTVRSLDSFPLDLKAQFNYYTDSARFGARRKKGRLHAGIDLYTIPRWDPKADNKWGEKVYAIDDGEVVSVALYTSKKAESKRHIKRVTVQSKHGYTWNYAEIGKIQVKVGDAIKRKQLIGTTADYIRQVEVGKKYPAMLHLEKYSKLIKSPKEGKLKTHYKRNAALVNPSCHIEYMQRIRFGGNGYDDF